MVGDAGGPGRPAAELRAAYDTGPGCGPRVPSRCTRAWPAHWWPGPVDEVLASFGYRPPPWYVTFKHDTEPWASDPVALGRDTAAAGYTDVRLRTVTVDTGRSSPAELASWRLGMAHVAPFVGALTVPRRAELRRAAEAAVTGAGPLVVDMLILTAR